MSPIPAPAKILVTGASGFIVRSASKGEYVKRLFEEGGIEKNRFSYVIVEDIEKEGAFDHAVVGVDAVEHTASPVTLVHSGDPDEIIQPALKGTLGILASVQKYAPGVKRVIITSSYAAVVTPKTPAPGQEIAIIDESDWNTLSEIEVKEKGKAAGGVHIYRASKVLAERAAWDFVESNKDSIGFDLVTICPPMVYGPMIHEAPLTGTSAEILRNGLNSHAEEDLLKPVNVSGYWVDVRDVAAVHVLALANPDAGGQRFITATGPHSWQDFLDSIHAAQKDPTDLFKGYPGKGRNPKVPAKVLATKAETTFNFKFRGVDDTIPAMFQMIQAKGF
ncbi:methylglyoxal reductase (NADPH-dependent) gre2 [Tulasnella sp. 330]|nr:methylglyoxal reductase (NADPH-dependent) gre2 [Tulasnella sp. 330]KAG8883913.1 methylglyoxal reductase (NADPH-dependent) gre2 [Tulasnella sp. 331]KAG8889232.1 methylglyoxal reductase (NADPH-dependent) gre2 [Tulasnella sp. 332]